MFQGATKYKLDLFNKLLLSIKQNTFFIYIDDKFNCENANYFLSINLIFK